MKRLFVYSALSVLFAVACGRQESMEELTDRVFERAAAQFIVLDVKVDSAAVAEGVEMLYPR